MSTFDQQMVIDTAKTIGLCLAGSDLKGEDRRSLIERKCRESLARNQKDVSEVRNFMSEVGRHMNFIKQQQRLHEKSMEAKLAEAQEDTVPPD